VIVDGDVDVNGDGDVLGLCRGIEHVAVAVAVNDQVNDHDRVNAKAA